ncbi:hypothetical protein EJB05_44453, partial [Eragrostis curvula]
SIADIAPLVVEAVPSRTQKPRLVSEALTDLSWTHDIQGGLSMIGLYELFQLADIISELTITENEDRHVWHLDASRQYTTKSAYRAFFNGAINFEPWRKIWKTWAPPKCKVFLWLAVRNRCWTADRLARRNMPHPASCLLCDQVAEDVQHILTTCVFAREFWFTILSRFGLQQHAPSLHARSFSDCAKRVQKEKKRKGFNSLVVLSAWMLWKHRNGCVFDGATPSMPDLLRTFEDEHHLWCMAGARSLTSLSAGLGHGLVG